MSLSDMLTALVSTFFIVIIIALLILHAITK